MYLSSRHRCCGVKASILQVMCIHGRLSNNPGRKSVGFTVRPVTDRIAVKNQRQRSDLNETQLVSGSPGIERL